MRKVERGQCLTAEQAAKILGLSATKIRCSMRIDTETGRKPARMPIGHAIKPEGGSRNWIYLIYRQSVAEYVGFSEWQEEWEDVING